MYSAYSKDPVVNGGLGVRKSFKDIVSRRARRKGRRIRGFEDSSGSLGIFFSKLRSEGFKKRRGRGVKDSRGQVVLLISFSKTKRGKESEKRRVPPTPLT